MESTLKTALGAGVVIIGITVGVIADRHQRDLIRSGKCTADAEAWYQPPPSMVCTWRETEGGCSMWRTVQDDPYLRTHWSCEGGEDFWRRKDRSLTTTTPKED